MLGPCKVPPHTATLREGKAQAGRDPAAPQDAQIGLSGLAVRLGGGAVVAPCPYVISWALSWGFFRSSSDSRQCRKLSSVTSGLGLTVILSLWFHTSRPIRATRRRRGW
uniref:Uncharacterized protein n=1 Tax=Ficedula albicollis TaxID=59894 RepID=A0A803V7L4_FICAL